MFIDRLHSSPRGYFIYEIFILEINPGWWHSGLLYALGLDPWVSTGFRTSVRTEKQQYIQNAAQIGVLNLLFLEGIFYD